MNEWLARLTAFARSHRALSALTAMASALVVALLSMTAVDRISFLTGADRFVQDWEVAFKTPLEKDQDPNIRIIAFDEEAMQHFPYRSPLDRGALADVLTALDGKGAKVIVLDYLFDQPTEPAKDDKLRAALRAMKTPVVASYFEAGSIVAADQTAYLNAFVPPRLRALPNLGTDQTDTVRWINPGGRTSGGEYLMSVQRRAAQIAGVATPDERVPIVWRAPPGTYQKVFSQIPACVQGVPGCLPITRILPAAILKGKVVLIGSDLSLVDQHRTPFATDPHDPRATIPGVQILAYGIAQFIEHRDPPQLSWWENFVIALLLAGVGAALGMLDMSLWLRGGAIVLLVAALWYLGVLVLYEHAGVLIGLIAPTLSLIVSFALVDSLSGLDARRQREHIRGMFSRYSPPSVVKILVDDPSKVVLGGERRDVSLLFTDIANFTTMSEGLDPKEVGRIINAYLDGMTKLVHKYDATVDKFIGDAVFAIFNAPLDIEDHPTKCVSCMLDMDVFTEEFRKQMNAEGVPLGLTRIGVHTGVASVGDFGSHERSSYTATGDVVNAASRLEGLNKTFGTRLCVSGATRVLCRGIAFRPIGSVVLKGKTEALDVFEPLHDGAMSADYLARYEAAYAACHAEHGDAFALFGALAKENPADPLVHFYLERLARGETGIKIKMIEK